MTSTEQPTRQLEPISNSSTSNSSFDLVCIGFGAAQLATAIANREARKPSNILFLERKPSFSWGSGSHIARTRMESPFIYDLATIRNPRTAFSYVNYLLARGRLVEFANSDRLNPLREEFEDYMKWSADQFKDQVRYGCEVVGVAPETEASTVKSWRIAVKDGNGKSYTVRTKSIIAPSLSQQSSTKPSVLTTVDFLSGQRIIPMNDYFSRRIELRGFCEPRLNVSVVGSGQQTLETIDDLLSCPHLGNITVVTQDESLAPLRILGEQEPPKPQLCSIWATPSGERQPSVTETSELIQNIYSRAYEKQVASKGEWTFRVFIGQDAAAPCSKSDFIVKDTTAVPLSSRELLQSLDTLVLGCHQRGESLEEVHFKHGAVAEDCRVWLMSAHSEGGRSLAKDIAVRAGEVVSALSSPTEGARDRMVLHARM
ncbi:hypothetical protein P153DRAFT_314094 [Dothidotthia symphoricarpi CBS 119687]|uniref:L-ornithine N(5)-monooxygenase [NAD(P)H] n=1 Tax=Dothidotthia symphoricarpi CBS 119687 TaxID=1392245 RepID=A0A6A6AET8_9PLEO|nr:uncharacterized protein P153DRAFT_314094 [Dothidotthia symphoricarpi CBS 119687]KAF2130330.1 hypothetical protein P153DRAFT_314094 [Dothidotthia symphoricarpi CBS 119687]